MFRGIKSPVDVYFLLSRQIARRFQVSSDAVHPILASLSTEQIEELGERFLESESLEEIRNWAEEKLSAKGQRTEELME